MAVDLGDGNTTRYYTTSAWDLPAGDWCIGIWTRVEDNSGSSFQYILGSGNFAANPSFNLFITEAGGTASEAGRWKPEIRDNAANTMFPAGGILSAEYGADGVDRLIVIQRAGGVNEFWTCPANGTAVLEQSNTGSFGALTAPTVWNIGRRSDGNVDRYYEEHFGGFFHGTTGLTKSQIEAIASGTRPQDLSGVTVLGYWPFTDPDPTVEDAIGTDDATRHGTNYPPASPDFPGTAGGTDATATPAGVEATGEIGTVSVSTSTTVALTGLEAAGEVGTAATVAAAVAAPTGVEGQGRVGSVATAYGGAATVAGIEGATAVGTVIVSAGVNDNAAPTGVGGVGTVGTVTVALDGTAAVEGVSGTGRVGSVLAGAGTGAVVSGVQGAGAVGTVSVSTDAAVPVVGVAASGEIGASDVTIGAAVAVTGVAAVGQVGTVSAFEAAAVTFGRITVTQSAATAISVSARLATGLATDAREVTGLEATESAA